MAYIPLDLLEGKLQAIKVELTVIPKEYGESIPLPIFLYDMSVDGYIGVPIDWGLNKFSHLQFEDRTSKGNGVLLNASKQVDPYHKNASPGQADFINNMIKVCTGHFTCFAVAQTRTGKTPSSLAVASHFNMRTLILVDSHTLADQWILEIKDKLGIPDSRIAKIAGKGTDNYTASICVGMVHTLSKCRFPEKFYSSFGTIIFDEVHAYGSATFSKVINMFNSTVTLGLTATDKRGDRAEFCYRATLGPVRVVSKSKSMKLTVYAADYKSRPLWGDNPSSLKTQLTKDVNRNRFIAELIAEAYKHNRVIFVISDRIEHLEELLERAVNLGVPREVCGLFTGQRTVNGKRVLMKAEELAKIKKTSKVIFSTYGKGKKGLDIPRLDFGIDATPAAEAEQVAGRVRTPMDGKPDPMWVTIVDRHVPLFVGFYRKRLKDYYKIDSEVIEGMPEWI